MTLNRAVALAMVEGPAAGLPSLDDLEQDKRLARHHRLHAVRAHLLELAGETEKAREQLPARVAPDDEHPRAGPPPTKGRSPVSDAGARPPR